MNEAVKHSFLVFVLDQGQKLWGCEYRFMRVERQQQQDAADARLNIRFCRDPLVVQGLDIPGLSEEDKQALTAEQLQQHGIEQLTELRMQLSPGQCLLGDAFKAMSSVHKSHPRYSLSKANCMWFVKGVLHELAAATEADNLRTLKQQFSDHPRYIAAAGLKPVKKCFNKFAELIQLDIQGLAIASRADTARLGRAAVASGTLSSRGVVKATSDAFDSAK
ncbi:hypothetical protein OEZ86_008419 [Tetradesmus obliquus]|nr:hypothetical protein OEZ86_008419 [Tetradesmus obliquus]